MLQSLSRELWTSRHQSIAYNVLIPLQPQLTAASAHSFLRFSPAPAVPLTGTFLTFLQFPCHSALFFVLKTVFHRPQASLSPQSLPPGHLSLPPCYGQWTLLLSAPQGVKVKVLVTQSCPALWDPMNCSLPGSTVHDVLQDRILEWFAISFSRESSQPRGRSSVSCMAGRFFLTEPPGKFPALAILH